MQKLIITLTISAVILFGGLIYSKNQLPAGKFTKENTVFFQKVVAQDFPFANEGTKELDGMHVIYQQTPCFSVLKSNESSFQIYHSKKIFSLFESEFLYLKFRNIRI